jgi:uncharacterized membrane protein YdbT with pleckstrin-like domain
MGIPRILESNLRFIWVLVVLIWFYNLSTYPFVTHVAVFATKEIIIRLESIFKQATVEAAIDGEFEQ